MSTPGFEIIHLIKELGLGFEILKTLKEAASHHDELWGRVLNANSRFLLKLATRHLEFVLRNELPLDYKNRSIGKTHIRGAYPEHFEAWVLAGHPGLDQDLAEDLIGNRYSENLEETQSRPFDRSVLLPYFVDQSNQNLIKVDYQRRWDAIRSIRTLDLEKDLLLMLTSRSSPYFDEKSHSTLDGYTRNLCSGVSLHLEFFINFGGNFNIKQKIFTNNRIETNYPEDFYAWVISGCPGISYNNLKKLIAASNQDD